MKITIAPEALADLLLAIKLCPVEISGLGKVKEISKDNFLIEELIVFNQKCSMCRTEFDLSAYGLFLHNLMKEGRGEEINSFRLWWHSHVYSKARWSDIDNNNISRFDGCPYMISIVGNKHNFLTVRLDYFQPERLILDNLDLDYGDVSEIKRLMESREENMKRLIAEKVIIMEEEDEN